MTQAVTTSTEAPAAPPPDPEATEAAELAEIMASAKTAEPAKVEKAEPEKPKAEPAADASPRAFIGLKKKQEALTKREAELTAKAAEVDAKTARLVELAKTDKLAAIKELGLDPNELLSALLADNTSTDKDPVDSRAQKRIDDLEKRDAQREAESHQAKAEHVAREFIGGVEADTAIPLTHAWVELQGQDGRAKLVAAADHICNEHHERTGRWPNRAELHAALEAGAKVDLLAEQVRAKRLAELFGNGADIPGKANGAAAARAPAGNGSVKPGGTLSHGALASAPPEGETDEEEEARLLALIRSGK